MTSIQKEDPYSLTAIENLLETWEYSPERVFFAIKAISDIVRFHGNMLKEFEHSLSTKSSKSELNAALATKPNISDIITSLSEITSSINNKPNIEDIQDLIDERFSYNNSLYQISKKISYEELNNALQSKVDLIDYKKDYRVLYENLNDVTKKIQETLSEGDARKIYEILETKANLEDVNELLQHKANKQTVANALHRKANRGEIESILASKADIRDLQNLLGAIEAKVEYSALESIKKEIDQKCSKKELDEFYDRVKGLKNHECNSEILLQDWNKSIEKIKQKNEQEINKIVNEIKNLDEKLQFKADQNSINQILENLNTKPEKEQIEEIYSQNSKINAAFKQVKSDFTEKYKNLEFECKRFEDELGVLKKNLENSKEKITKDSSDSFKEIKRIFDTDKAVMNETLKLETLEREKIKTSMNELVKQIYLKKETEDAIESANKDLLSKCKKESKYNLEVFNSGIAEIKTEMRSILNNLEKEFLVQLEKKLNFSDFSSEMETKADISALERAIASRVSHGELEEVKAEIEQLLSELKRKANLEALDNSLKSFKELVEEISKELLLKGNIKDILALLDTKATIEEVNKSIEDIYNDLQLKAPLDDFNSHISDQALINEALCAENCIARWIWKNGETRGNSVVWEIQSVNTCPDNFIWEKDCIQTLAPGLYEITYAFFARKKPTVTLVINGEPIGIAGGSQCTKTWTRHPAGNISGLSVIDFLALPARARISFVFSSEANGEGFLGLKKL